MFKLDADSIHLVKERDQKAIFPGPSGRFNPCRIVAGASYQVLGDVAVSLGHDTAQLFGAYCSSLRFAAPHPPALSTKRSQFSKENFKRQLY